MTKEEFEIKYDRALAKRDWVAALGIVNERIDHATDKHELSYLKGECDTCKENQPRKGLSLDWLSWGKKRKVTE